MIRDLRYQEAERDANRSRRTRFMVILIAISALVTTVVGREIDLHRKFEAIPAVDESNPKSMRIRRDSIDAFIDDHKVWAGLLGATRERAELMALIAEQERVDKQAQAEQREKVSRDRELAEAARQRGLMYSERQEYEKALEDFERALELGDPNWSYREEIERDCAALRKWKESQGG